MTGKGQLAHCSKWAERATGLVYFIDLEQARVHFSPLWMKRAVPASNPAPFGGDGPFFWVAQADRSRLGAALERFRKDADPVVMEYSLYWQDTIWPGAVVEHWTPYFGEEGEIRGLVSTGAWRTTGPYDVPVKRIPGTTPENHFLETQQVYHRAIDASGAGIWNWDLVHREDFWWSPRFFEILGYENGAIEPSMRTLRHRVHPDDRNPVYRELKLQLRGSGPFIREFRMRHAGGDYRWVQVRGSTVRNEAGRPIQFSGSMIDIHDKKTAEDQLREQSLELEAAKRKSQAATLAKNEFLAIVSHELRTPINGMMAGIEILDSAFEAPENREIWEIVKTCSRTLKALINDILDIARMESGQLEIRTEAVNLPRVVERSVEHLRLQAAESFVKIHLSLDSNLPKEIQADGHRLRQILAHLLSNALKFTPRGEIRIHGCMESPDWVKISITDTGIGIAEEDLERIFEPFEQVDSSATRRYEGVGLGLTLSRRLARTMQGEVSVESSPGRGSTFILHLPVSLDALEAPFPRTSEESEPVGQENAE